MSTGFDPYYTWLGIPPADQPPHHYRLLGVNPFEENPTVIEHAADRQMAHLRNFQAGKHSALSQQLLNEVAAARVCLLRPDKKAAYDAQLHEILDRQSSGEDTSTQLQALRALDQAIADEIARPVSQRRKQTSERPPWLAVGVAAAVLLIGVVVWSLFGRGKPQEAARPGGTAGLPSSVAAPPQSLAKAEVGSRQPAVGSQQKPSAQDPRPKTQDPASKRPVPSAADQEKSKKEAQDLFRDDYAKAKKPSERAELARAILKKGVETRDPPANHFVLLCLARDVAISADDDNLAYETIDAIAKSFEVDPLSLKADALVAMSKSTRSSVTLHKTFCERSLALGQEALDQDKLDVADTLAKLSFSEAGKVRDKDLVQRCRALAKDQQEAAKAFSAVQDAFKILQEKPDDPAANLAVGKYLCFTKNDWEKGLPHLARGSDAKLKSLAQRELESPPEKAEEQLELADAWWSQAQTERPRNRQAILARAGSWYQYLSADISNQLMKAKVARRLEEVRSLGCPLGDMPNPRLKRLPRTIVNSIGMQLVHIPPGEFEMGSGDAEIELIRKEAGIAGKSPGNPASEKPRHRVRITKSFYFGTFEVTRAEYARVMKTAPSYFGRRDKLDSDYGQRPVEVVTWGEATDFCRRLSELPEEKARRRAYRLPTEAEWEYACRAGSTTRYYFGDDDKMLIDHAWFKENAGDRTHPVGRKKPNRWGLYDMLGNVTEWCADSFDHSYYAASASDDPTGPATAAAAHVVRGGGFLHESNVCRDAYRGSYGLDFKYSTIGFRVACELRSP